VLDEPRSTEVYGIYFGFARAAIRQESVLDCPAGGAALVRLENDIRAVLRMAETVIKLDFFAAGRLRDAERAATST